MSKLTVKSLVDVLRRVPEKTFRISDLAPQLIDETGKVDIDKALDQAAEINSAVAEVEGYIKDTRSVTDLLEGVKGGRIENFNEEDLMEGFEND